MKRHRERRSLLSVDCARSPGYRHGEVFNLNPALLFIDADAEGHRLDLAKGVDHGSDGIASLRASTTGRLGSGLRGHFSKLLPQRLRQHRGEEGEGEREVIGERLKSFARIDVVGHRHACGADQGPAVAFDDVGRTHPGDRKLPHPILILHRADQALQRAEQGVEILGGHAAAAADDAVVAGDDQPERLPHIQTGKPLALRGHHQHPLGAAGEHRVARFAAEPGELFLQIAVAVHGHHGHDVGRFGRGRP